MLLYSLPLIALVSTLSFVFRAHIARPGAALTRPFARKRTATTPAATPARRRLAVELLKELALEEVVALIVKALIPAAITLLVGMGVRGAADLPLEGLDKVREHLAPTETAHPAPTAPASRYVVVYVPYERR